MDHKLVTEGERGRPCSGHLPRSRDRQRPQNAQYLNVYNAVRWQLLDHLERVAFHDPEVAQLEFSYFDFLDDHSPSRALFNALGQDPGQFVELVAMVYRAEGEPVREFAPAQKGRLSLAYSILHNWPSIPTSDAEGHVDADRLWEWISAVRGSLIQHGRRTVGDEVLGQVLSASPHGDDGIWPVEAVRNIVELIRSDALDTGLHIGKKSRRGVTSRGVFDGGDQERELDEEYGAMAAQAASRWPRTARILRGIADSYREESRIHDARAELLGDQG